MYIHVHPTGGGDIPNAQEPRAPSQLDRSVALLDAIKGIQLKVENSQLMKSFRPSANVHGTPGDVHTSVLAGACRCRILHEGSKIHWSCFELNVTSDPVHSRPAWR